MDKIFKIGVVVLSVIILTAGCNDNSFETSEQKLAADMGYDETRHSIEVFFEGYEHFVSAGNLLRGMSSSQDPVEDYKKAVTLLNKSKENLTKCDPELLDNAYSDWGDVLSNKLIPAIDIYIAEAKPNSDRNKLQRGDELIVEFDVWLARNWSDALLILNEKYGYEVK